MDEQKKAALILKRAYLRAEREVCHCGTSKTYTVKRIAPYLYQCQACLKYIHADKARHDEE